MSIPTTPGTLGRAALLAITAVALTGAGRIPDAPRCEPLPGGRWRPASR